MERDPAAVLQAAIRGVVDRLPESVKEEKADVVTFQQAKYFVGRKDGFYFGTGSNGTGQAFQASLDRGFKLVQFCLTYNICLEPCDR